MAAKALAIKICAGDFISAPKLTTRSIRSERRAA
jgi:hypothetical protein